MLGRYSRQTESQQPALIRLIPYPWLLLQFHLQQVVSQRLDERHICFAGQQLLGTHRQSNQHLHQKSRRSHLFPVDALVRN